MNTVTFDATMFKTVEASVSAACRRYGRPEMSDDIGQDVAMWVSTSGVLEKYDASRGASIQTFVSYISRNKALSFLSSKGYRNHHNVVSFSTPIGDDDGMKLEDTIVGGHGADYNVEADEQREKLEKALESLNETDRTLILALGQRGYDRAAYEEVCQSLGITYGNARKRLCLARKKMADILGIAE